MGFKISDLKQWRRVIAKTWETNEVNLWLPQLTAWREIPGCRAVTLSWEARTRGPVRPKVARFQGQSNRQKRTGHRESSRDLQRDPLKYLGEYRSARAKEENTQGWRKNYLKDWRKQSSKLTQDKKIVLISTKQSRKPHIWCGRLNNGPPKLSMP